MKVYILVGCSGEYEDYWEDLITAFPSEERAIAYADQLEKWLDELRKAEVHDWEFWDEVDFDDDLAIEKATIEENARWANSFAKLEVPESEWQRLRYRVKKTDPVWYQIKEVPYEV